jgi:hypothetical protein
MRIEQSRLALAGESTLMRQEIRTQQRAAAAPVPQAAAEAGSPEDTLETKLLMMLRIAEMILGKKIHLFRAPAANRTPPPAPVEVSTSSVQVQVEREQVRFRAQGRVRTAEGRQIEFRADLALSREFVQINGATNSANKQDPLVLNFDGKGVRLSGQRFQFDLNGDGQTEAVPRVVSGSGILFEDRNGDGVPTDGTELFGPRTGDGFRELAGRDADGNGWIDENDPVFGQLRVWFTDGGSYDLRTLGVGAISTSSVQTQFDLRTVRDGLLGQLRASGLYLRESGEAGIVQQVDFTV